MGKKPLYELVCPLPLAQGYITIKKKVFYFFINSLALNRKYYKIQNIWLFWQVTHFCSFYIIFALLYYIMVICHIVRHLCSSCLIVCLCICLIDCWLFSVSLFLSLTIALLLWTFCPCFYNKKRKYYNSHAKLVFGTVKAWTFFVLVVQEKEHFVTK